MGKINKQKAIQSLKDRFGPQYDSDEELTIEEKKEIRDSEDPSATREKIWKRKPAYQKLTKMLKSGWYGDKQKD